jgi:hypothetical protein
MFKFIIDMILLKYNLGTAPSTNELELLTVSLLAHISLLP